MTNRDDIPVTAVLLPPVLVCAAMLSIAACVCLWTGIDGSKLFLPYLGVAIPASIIALLCALFVQVLLLARQGADEPVKHMQEWFRRRYPLMLLPGLILPIFLAGFTITKTGIPFIVGFGWEAFWAEADRLIFREDVWQLAHSFLGERSAPVLSWFYTMGWGVGFILVGAFVTFSASRGTVGVFYTAMLSTWLLGGCLTAYAFSAAGPVFAHLADPEVGQQFEGLKITLANVLAERNSVRLTQLYLEHAVGSHLAVKGGGISAMPSMHVGAACIFVLLGRRTLWVLPAVVFTLIIFVASGYFGYHYWVDGIAAAGIAWACWSAAELCYKARPNPVSANVSAVIQSVASAEPMFTSPKVAPDAPTPIQ